METATFTPEQVSRRLRIGMQFLKMSGEENNAQVKDKFLSLIEQSQEDFAKRGWEPYRRILNQAINGN